MRKGGCSVLGFDSVSSGDSLALVDLWVSKKGTIMGP